MNGSNTSVTILWLDFACDCGYLPQERRDAIVKGYEEVGRMLGDMLDAPEKFGV